MPITTYEYLLDAVLVAQTSRRPWLGIGRRHRRNRNPAIPCQSARCPAPLSSTAKPALSVHNQTPSTRESSRNVVGQIFRHLGMRGSPIESQSHSSTHSVHREVVLFVERVVLPSPQRRPPLKRHEAFYPTCPALTPASTTECQVAGIRTHLPYPGHIVFRPASTTYVPGICVASAPTCLSPPPAPAIKHIHKSDQSHHLACCIAIAAGASRFSPRAQAVSPKNGPGGPDDAPGGAHAAHVDVMESRHRLLVLARRACLGHHFSLYLGPTLLATITILRTPMHK